MSDVGPDDDRLFGAFPLFDRDGAFSIALFTPILFVVQFGPPQRNLSCHRRG
jgi:hypothetical protein